MSGLRSRRKGAGWERDIARRWRESRLYPHAERGLGQARGGAEVPDVDGTPYWVQAKHCKRLDLMKALEQAEAEARGAEDPRTPVVVAKRDRDEPVVLMRLSAWEALVMKGQSAT